MEKLLVEPNMPKDEAKHAYEITTAIVNYININNDVFRTDRVTALAEAKATLTEKLEAALKRP
jgi:hypothetical protein